MRFLISVVVLIFALCMVCLGAKRLAAQAPILFTEDFNRDGLGTRYSGVGFGSRNESSDDGYWQRSVLTPIGRRLAFPLDDDIRGDQYTAEAMAVFDQAIRWLTQEAMQPTSLRIAWVLNSLDDNDVSDVFWIRRLESQGHTVKLIEMPNRDFFKANMVADQDLVIISDDINSNRIGDRLRHSPVPILNTEAALNDNFRIARDEAGNADRHSLQIRDASHPVVQGRSEGEIVRWLDQARELPQIRDLVVDHTVVVATYLVVPTVNSLRVVDLMLSGDLPTTQVTDSFEFAAFNDNTNLQITHWARFASEPPGTEGRDDRDHYAIVARGVFEVHQTGDYSFAIAGDDGGRLRIDLNRDGMLDGTDDVIVDDAIHGYEASERFGSISLPKGDYPFEWIGFEQTGDAAWALSYKPGANQQSFSERTWDVSSTDSLFEDIRIKEPFEVTSYFLDRDAAGPIMPSDDPAIVAIDARPRADTVGGFANIEGEAYFAGQNLDEDFGGLEASPDMPRVLQLNPIDVASAANPKLTFALAAPQGPWESVDFLRVLIDLENDGSFETLVEYRGGFEGGTVSDGTVILSSTFQDVSFDLPAASRQLVIRFEAYSTGGDEVMGLDHIRISDGALRSTP